MKVWSLSPACACAQPSVRQLSQDACWSLYEWVRRVHVLVLEGAVQRVAFVEAAHRRVGAEVVVEGAVLLDEDDDVLDVPQPSRLGRGGEDAEQGLVEERGAGQRGASLEQVTPGEKRLGHVIF